LDALLKFFTDFSLQPHPSGNGGSRVPFPFGKNGTCPAFVFLHIKTNYFFVQKNKRWVERERVFPLVKLKNKNHKVIFITAWKPRKKKHSVFSCGKAKGVSI